MGKTSGSFKKGEGGNRKGIKNKKTQFIESIGLDSWEKLQQSVLNKGAEKAVDELMNLKGSQYVLAYLQLLEYVKPKLARTDSNINLKAEVKNFIIELTDDDKNGVEKI